VSDAASIGLFEKRLAELESQVRPLRDIRLEGGRQLVYSENNVIIPETTPSVAAPAAVAATASVPSDVQAQLDGKAALAHTHGIADVAELQAALDAKMRLHAIDVKQHGAVGDGITDDSAVIATIRATLTNPVGGITGLRMLRVIGGFASPDPDPATAWAARPSVTAVGGLGTGFSAKGNIGPNGYLTGFEILNRGSNYEVVSVGIDRTNGSPTITKSGGGAFDSRLVAGVAVAHESLSATATIVARSGDGTTLTLSQNNTFTNSDTFVFGMPWIEVAGVAYATDIVPLVGTPKAVYFPPGTYRLPNGLGPWCGKSNLTIYAEGVTFEIEGAGAQGIWVRHSTNVVFFGGKFHFKGSKYYTPATRERYPGASGVSIACCRSVEFVGTEVWNYFDFGFSIAGGSDAGTMWSSDISLRNVQAGNGCGDGIHFTHGSRRSRVTNATIIHPQDDALAVVNDGGGAMRPYEVIFSTCRILGGIYRGCVAIGCDKVSFQNIHGKDTHGPFCWAADDGGFGAPTDVEFCAISGFDLGNNAVSVHDTNSGVGIYANGVTRLIVRALTFTQHSSVIPLARPTYNVLENTITGLDSDEQQIVAISGSGTLGAAMNADLVCSGASGFAEVTLPPGRWFLSGSVTSRSATGSACRLYARFWDGAAEFGASSGYETSDLGLRFAMPVTGFTTVLPGTTKTVCFKIKVSGGGETIDAGTAFGPNSAIHAIRVN
jgi:hypothetical protein